MCQAFPGRFPTEVFAERDRLPEGFLEEVIEAGYYERAFEVHEHNPRASGGLIDIIQTLEFEDAAQEIAARKQATKT